MKACLCWWMTLGCVLRVWSSAESAPETNLTTALARARTEQKLVILHFTSLGTDWCSACQRLDAEVSRTTEFRAYASTNFVVVVMDDQSPQSATLEEKYDVGSWPTMLVLDAKGAVLGRVAGYAKGTGWAKVTAELDKIRQSR